ncbi:MAG: phage tail tube protein [Minwuia sp.]|nr:phage tail tube protein [Minwuia sp.]
MANQTRARGVGSVLLGAFESTYATAGPVRGGGVYTQYPFNQYTLGKAEPITRDPLLGIGRDVADSHADAFSVAGNIRVPVDHIDFGAWLKLMLGAPDTTDNEDTTYDHVFTGGGSDLPSMALQLGHTHLSTVKRFRHTGVRANSMSLESGRGGPAWATMDLIAQDEAEEVSAIDGSPVVTNILVPNHFQKRRGIMTLGGSAIGSLMGWSLNMSNNLEVVESIRTDGLIEDADPGEFLATGSLTIRFSTATDVPTPGKNKTPVALALTYDNADSSRSLTFALPRVFLPQVAREVDGPDGIEVTYNFEAAKDATAGYAARATLVNGVASY